jgi:serine protease
MPAPASTLYTGRIVVRVNQLVVNRIMNRAHTPGAPDLETLQDLTTPFDLDQLGALFGRYPPHPTQRALRGIPNIELLAREEQAQRSPFPPQYSLTAYFVADPRVWEDEGRANRYLADLQATPGIDLAYRERKHHGPNKWAVDPSDPLVKDQRYLDPAPGGIGANTADVWGSFDGSGIGFVDVEAGWNLNHVDLPSPTNRTQPLVNLNDPLQADHGTGSLGVVLGQPNGKGITGIAPRATFHGVSSWVANLQDETDDVPLAISTAVGVLKPGDVLLVEVETLDGYPVEIDDLEFQAIKIAAGNDRIVIEAAGNGTPSRGRDLDQASSESRPGFPLKRRPGFDDSGAIMVSACRAALTSPPRRHRRKAYAGYGSRIDCFAWGDSVATTGGSGLGSTTGPNSSYTDSFAGTSSAAAIVAGIALLVQQAAESSLGRRLTATEMRAHLFNPALGTGVLKPTGNQQIGVMPDLQAIVRNL